MLAPGQSLTSHHQNHQPMIPKFGSTEQDSKQPLTPSFEFTAKPYALHAHRPASPQDTHRVRTVTWPRCKCDCCKASLTK